jgi:hypothetical protein
LKGPLIEILKATKAPDENIRAAKHFKCDECERTKQVPRQTSKVSLPTPYIFNDELGIDVNYLKDCDGTTFKLLNLVDMGTGFQMAWVLSEGKGTPSSLQCLDTVMQHWVSWAGYPRKLRSDRGLNNRGVLLKELSAAGVDCSNIGLEAPYQLGKVERHGDMWKKIAAKVIETKEIRGVDAMRMVSAEVNAVINGMSRVGGFSPAQWVTGRQPRHGGGERGDDEQRGQLGSLEESRPNDDIRRANGDKARSKEGIRVLRFLCKSGQGVVAKGGANVR